MVCCNLTPFLLTNIVFLEGETGKISTYSNINDSDKDSIYIHLMDNFVPYIVSSKLWNYDQCMEQHCGANQAVFHANIFMISDEAFLLLVLVSYTARWKAELNAE